MQHKEQRPDFVTLHLSLNKNFLILQGYPFFIFMLQSLYRYTVVFSLDRFDDGWSDYVERLKKSFKTDSSLIPSLLLYCSAEKLWKNITFPLPKSVLTASDISNSFPISS